MTDSSCLDEPEPARLERPAWLLGAELVLASRSPRRRDLLSRAGILHRTIESGVDDGELRHFGAVTPAEWVAALAWLKARSGVRAAPEGSVVLGADTVCVVDGRVLGQPADEGDAARMIREMASREHDVITGVALCSVVGVDRAGERLIFVDRATVRVGALGEDAISSYLRSGSWRGKAGAYNLEERTEAGWPLECIGDPATVMGLPMRKLRALLRAERDET